jgi:hypothetical protein
MRKKKRIATTKIILRIINNTLSFDRKHPGALLGKKYQANRVSEICTFYIVKFIQNNYRRRVR